MAIKLDNANFSADKGPARVNEAKAYHFALVAVLAQIAKVKSSLPEGTELSADMKALRQAICKSRDWNLHDLMTQIEEKIFDAEGVKAAKTFLQSQRKFFGDDLTVHAVRSGVIGKGDAAADATNEPAVF